MAFWSLNRKEHTSPSPSDRQYIRLSMLLPHDHFVIHSIKVGQEVGRRLADMGFTEGTPGVVVRRGAMGGPMQVRLRGYDLLIRKDEAAEVEVDLVDPAARPRGRRHRLMPR